MAKKKPKPPKRPQSAAEKAANANLTRAQQIALAQQGARIKGASKGAFGARKLRAGGTEMQQYALDRFQKDPFPGLGPGGGPSYGPSTASGQPSAPSAPSAGTPGNHNAQGGKAPKPKPQGGTGGAKGTPTTAKANQEKARARAIVLAAQARARAAAEAKKQKAAAALKAAAKAAAKAKAKKAQDAGAGVVKPPKGGTGTVMS